MHYVSFLGGEGLGFLLNDFEMYPHCVCIIHFFYSFLLLSNPLYSYTSVCLFIYLLTDSEAISSFSLLEINLLLTFMYEPLCRFVFPLLLGVKWLGPVVRGYLTFGEATRLFSRFQHMRVQFSTSLLTLGSVSLLNFSQSNGYVMVLCYSLACISLLTNNVESRSVSCVSSLLKHWFKILCPF